MSQLGQLGWPGSRITGRQPFSASHKHRAWPIRTAPMCGELQAAGRCFLSAGCCVSTAASDRTLFRHDSGAHWMTTAAAAPRDGRAGVADVSGCLLPASCRQRPPRRSSCVWLALSARPSTCMPSRWGAVLVVRSACAAELEADRDSQLTSPCANHVACATTCAH